MLERRRPAASRIPRTERPAACTLHEGQRERLDRERRGETTEPSRLGKEVFFGISAGFFFGGVHRAGVDTKNQPIVWKRERETCACLARTPLPALVASCGKDGSFSSGAGRVCQGERAPKESVEINACLAFFGSPKI